VNTNELKNEFQGGFGKLVTKGTEFKYDVEGNLTRKVEANGNVWQYEYYSNNMLAKVIRPDGTVIAFKYDPLGRRIEKQTSEMTKYFLWDGNNPLHEWEDGNSLRDLVTWVFNDGFVPTAKLTNGGNYSIVSDYLGTPVEAYDAEGVRVWSAELDIFGRVKEFTGEVDFVPFRYQGQYADIEMGLYYNRFRYYDPESGQYTQQDPIGLAGNNPTLYAYVADTNLFIDIFGLNPSCRISGSKVSNASDLPIIRSGTREWKEAIAALRRGGRGDIRVSSAREAKELLREARGNMNRYRNYSPKSYDKGYEVHNVLNARELSAGNNLRHIKWRDWLSTNSGSGHIYY